MRRAEASAVQLERLVTPQGVPVGKWQIGPQAVTGAAAFLEGIDAEYFGVSRDGGHAALGLGVALDDDLGRGFVSAVVVAESGVRGADDVAHYAAHGANAILVGEALVSDATPRERIAEFTAAGAAAIAARV